MKKSIVFGALALAGTAFAVESAVVGYTSKEAQQGKFLIVGAQFESTSGGTAINDLFSGVEGVDYDDSGVFKTTAPQIQIPIPAGYAVYYYLNDGWYDNGTLEGGFKPGWCSSEGVLVDVGTTPGVAVWFKSVSKDGDAVVSGAVAEESSATVSCPINFALRANVFPKAVTLNADGMTSDDIVGVDYDDSGAFKATAPQIQIPIPAGYAVYYYLNDGWYDNGTLEGGFKPGWCTSEGVLVDATISAGQGFWTKGVTGPFTLEFTK